MSSPFFSLIIPTYNAESTIQSAVKSIVDQTFTEFELIIADGLSSDRTIEKINNFKDDRIKIFSEKDKSIYDAMNKAFGRSRGEWVYFLGADDGLYDINVLKDIAKIASNKSIDAIYGDVLRTSSNTRYDGVFTETALLTKNICHQALFLKRNMFTRFGSFSLKYKILSDWDHNLRWFFSSSVNKVYTDRVIAIFSDSGISSTTVDQVFINDLPEKYLKFVDKRKIPRPFLRSLIVEIALKKYSQRKYVSFGINKMKHWFYKIF